MGGSDENAEQLRRYPLTWTTLGCLFERISLFSLSKVFLERKFIVVLQQSAKDISKPQSEDKTKPGKDRKRKRDDPFKFDIESLRSPSVLASSASALFEALSKLLDRLTATTSRDAEDVLIGAEHIKSIFRTPAEDAKELVAPLSWICVHSLKLLPLHGGLSETQEQWPKVLITIWELHLGGAEDSREFASHLYYPCCIIIDTLLGLDKVQGNLIRKEAWQVQFHQFVTRNLVNPAKNSFINGNGLAVLDLANAASGAEPAVCLQILWRIVGLTIRNAEDLPTRKVHLTWAQNVFKLLLSFAEEKKVAAEVIPRILSWARFAGCPPELDTLTHIFKNYCFQSSDTEWPLVSNIVSCDADVFILNDELLSILLDRVTMVTEGDKICLEDTVEGVINQLMEAFAKARDLVSFVKKWHRQLSLLITKGVSLKNTPWYDPRAREQFASLLQGALSVQQVSTLVDWLRAQDNKAASLVILDAVCQGVKDEAYIDALGEKLRDVLLANINARTQTPALMASWWRVTAATVSWVSATDVNLIWNHLGGDLSETLSSGSLLESATFESFICCYKLCLSNYPHGRDLDDTLKLTCAFLERITEGVKDASRISALYNYLESIFSFLPVLSKATGGDEQISHLIGKLYGSLECHLSDYKTTSSRSLLERIPNENIVEDEEDLVEELIRPLISTLETSDVCGWTDPSGETTISTLLTFPAEAFTKERRKRIMSSWKKWKSNITHNAQKTQFFKLVLRLLVLVMAQPTFYDVSQTMPRKIFRGDALFLPTGVKH